MVNVLDTTSRHPEKAAKPDTPVLRKPDWIRVKAPGSAEYAETRRIVRAASRHFITDLYCMASCDGIIGPPSTFSQWASFYGKVPLSFIFTKDDVIQLREYKHVDNP